jgi:hypothetical protein
VHPDLDAIVAADAAAVRDVEAAERRLSEAENTERARLQAAREASAAAGRAQLEEEVRRIDAAGMARVNERRAAREARRAVTRERAEHAIAAAVEAYLRIVRGDEGSTRS